MLGRLFFLSSVAVAAAGSIFRDETMQQIDQELSADCGDACVQTWHGLVANVQSSGAVQRVEDVLEQVQGAHASFLTEKENQIRSEIAANGCNYGRILTTSTYQGLNLIAHVLSIVSSVVCGCVHVGPASKCALSKIYMFCQVPDRWRADAFSRATSAWESVKAMTRKCGVHGAPQIIGA